MSLDKKFETLANAAIVVLCVTIIGVVVWRFVIPHTPDRVAGGVPIGRRLQIPNTNWASTQTTVVFALSTTCHYCRESAPLYRSIVSLAHRRGSRVIAVLPQNQQEAEQYLIALNIPVDVIATLPLNTIGVRGTPTVLVVGRTGIVVDGWAGAVPAEENENVLKRVAPKDHS